MKFHFNIATFICILFLIIIPREVSAINIHHPKLLFRDKGIKLARERIRYEQWAKDLYQSLLEQANKLESIQLPVFEKDWWKEASKKPWQEIYPEIGHHTNFAVAEPTLTTRNAALAYLITCDRKYRDAVRKVLLHYTNYDFFAKHPDVGLNWSIWCLRLLQSYDIIYNTLDENDKKVIDDFFFRAMNAIKENDQWWIDNNPGGKFNNHYAWHKIFIGIYGIFYDKKEYVDYAMESNQGIRELIEYGALDDGLWFESSINYHFTAAIPLAIFANTLTTSNWPLDLWNMTFANGRKLIDLFIAPIETLFPDESIPTIGDTYGKRTTIGSHLFYYNVFNAYPDPKIAWILKNSKRPFESLFFTNLPFTSPNPPKMQTRIWPEHGYIALRSNEGEEYWTGKGFSAFLSFDINSIHSHNDKFDLMIFGNGCHIATDPEALSTVIHSFSSQIQAELNRSTVCHNTVMVDQKEQNSTSKKLSLIEFRNGNSVKMATIADLDGIVYPNVKMMRTVALTPEYVLDIFQVDSKEIHTYDYLMHLQGDKNMLILEGDSEPIALEDKAPWKWLKNARRYIKNENWKALLNQKDLKISFLMKGEPETIVITCDFPFKDDFSGDPVNMFIVRRICKSTVFVSLLQAERGSLPVADINVKKDGHGYIRVTVNFNGVVSEFTAPSISDMQ